VSSLRFRLPALFLAGVVVAAVVTALLAVRLFQDYARDRTLSDLHRQAAGLAQLYAEQARQGIEERRRAPRFARPKLERATGTRLYYAGVSIFPGQDSGLRPLPLGVLDRDLLADGKVQQVEFVPPGTDKTYLAVAQPIRLGGETFGALVVAKPQAELRERWIVLLGRLGLAFLAGLAIAALLVLYLSRRLTKPLLALSDAADRIAEGRYDVRLPEGKRKDEITHLTDRLSVSHELRTPLTAIRGHLDALREDLLEDPGERAASLEVIGTEADRLARLVSDLLDLAKLDAHRFTLTEDEVELRRLLDQAYRAKTEEARRRGIGYEQQFEADPVIHTDGDRVLQIVTNLLDNAFAWTPDGGAISIGLDSRNGTVEVTVSDSGPGVPLEERERIFRPFFSRDESRGTGLGLAIARELAHALGGELGLDSSPDGGARFELTLPAR
jgi:signal transduction histidine kinase